MASILPLFWHLSSVSRKERIDASVTLIEVLEQFQAKFEPKHTTTSVSDDDDDEDFPSKADELDVLNALDVSYSIRRLVRGLASPRESSRLGFAVALCELLSRINTVTCEQIVQLIDENTKSQGSMTGQEERDVLFARLFGLMSVIESGLCVRTGLLATSASSSASIATASSFTDLINRLIELGDKKSWLRESSWFVISLAIDVLKSSDVNWKTGAIDLMLPLFFEQNDLWSPEKVAITVKLQTLYPKRPWEKYIVPPFKNTDLLSGPNLFSLAKILKESSEEEDEFKKNVQKAPSGSWKPQLHFVWDILLDQLLCGPNATKTSKGSFQEFFRIVVDESLFSSTASPERKFWGFQVFQKALTRVTPDDIPMLFTKNFMRTWINHLSKRDRYLHKIAQQTASELRSFAKSSPHLGFSLVLQLTGVHGSQQFDKLTKTKTVESILTAMDVPGVQNYIEFLLSQANELEEEANLDIKVISDRRSWVIDQFGALIRNGGIPKDDAWISSVLEWLVVNGIFIVRKKSLKSPFKALHSIPKPAFSDDLRQCCRIRLLSCVSDLNSQVTAVKSGKMTTKVAAVASDGEFWVKKIITIIKQLEGDLKHVTPATDVGEGKALCDKALDVVAQLEDADIPGNLRESARGAQLLLLSTTLHYYCVEDEEEGRDTEALEMCIDSASRMFLPDERKMKSLSEDAGNIELEPVDVLVDTIIGFLENSTAYMRTVGNQVFSMLSSSVKESTIDLIVTQLERRDPGEDLEDPWDDEDMDENAVRKEDEKEDDNDTSGEDSQDENESLEHDDEAEIEEDVELRNKIEEALRVNGIKPATGETDDEEGGDFMDDDQMMAIDEQLAEVFRSQIDDKSRKDVDAQRKATHFKNRVLDLVDTFLRKQPSNPLVIRFLTPLIQLIVGSGQDERQLSDKAKGILRLRIGKYKFVPYISNIEEVTKCATDLHVRARKTHSSDTLSILSLCTIYLSKIIQSANSEIESIKLFRHSLVDFMTRKNSSLNTAFFQDFLRRFPVAAWGLRNDLIDLSHRAVNVYRQTQAFHLLESVIRQIPASEASVKDIVAFMASLCKRLLEAINHACTEKSTMTANQVKNLIKVGILAIRQTQRSIPEQLHDIWQTKHWSKLSDSLAQSPRLKTLAVLSKQMIVMTSKTPTNSKRKADPDAINDDKQLAHTKKAKINAAKGI